jgi:hypothetical protein
MKPFLVVIDGISAWRLVTKKIEKMWVLTLLSDDDRQP